MSRKRKAPSSEPEDGQLYSQEHSRQKLSDDEESTDTFPMLRRSEEREREEWVRKQLRRSSPDIASERCERWVRDQESYASRSSPNPRQEEESVFQVFVPISLKNHRGNDPVYGCSECSQCYETMKGLAHHSLQNHDIQIECFCCKKVYATFTRLVAHIRHRHGDTNVLCCFCKCPWPAANKMTHVDWRKLRTHMYGEMVYAKIAEYEMAEK